LHGDTLPRRKYPQSLLTISHAKSRASVAPYR
jgi:hypothetical protein